LSFILAKSRCIVNSISPPDLPATSSSQRDALPLPSQFSRLGQEQTYISKIERRSRRIDLIAFIELMNALEIPAKAITAHLVALGLKA